MKYLLLLTLISTFALTSCVPLEEQEIRITKREHDKTERKRSRRIEAAEYSQEVINERLVFVKHESSGLCFATFNIGYRSSVFTNVPCEEVAEQLNGQH